jgi:hypothetical protein
LFIINPYPERFRTGTMELNYLIMRTHDVTVEEEASGAGENVA